MIRRAALVVTAVRKDLLGQLANEQPPPASRQIVVADRSAAEQQCLGVPDHVVAEDVVLDVASQIGELQSQRFADARRRKLGCERERGDPVPDPGRDDVRMPRRTEARRVTVDPRFQLRACFRHVAAPRRRKDVLAVVCVELREPALRSRSKSVEGSGTPQRLVLGQGPRRSCRRVMRDQPAAHGPRHASRKLSRACGSQRMDVERKAH